MRYMIASPAADRLEWVLDGLNGNAGWGTDADDVLASEFTAVVPAVTFAEVVRRRAGAFAPITVIGFDAGEHTARARIRVRDGSVHVVTCAVDARAPHRITATRTMALIPEILTPRLPMDFTDSPLLAGTGAGAGAGASLIVFSGLPGTGKSTLADAAGRELGIPVFAADWLLGSLTPFGGYHLDGLLDISVEMLTTLAFRQLRLGQSAILDHPTEDQAARIRWRTLAKAAGATFRVIVCTCSDPAVHRARLERRERGIPGWHEGGNWANVQRRRAEFPPWAGDVLTVDAVRPTAENLAAVIGYITAEIGHGR